MKSRVLALCVLIASSAAPARAATLTEWKSGHARVRFVEVYTSDARKGALPVLRWVAWLQQDPGLWTSVVPAVFAVDYGDKPGRWKDRFATRAATRRLLGYAAKWGAGAPFVPTVVVDGVEWSGWARGDALPPPDAADAGVLVAQKTAADEIRVRFEPRDVETRRWTAHAALLGFGLPVRADGGDNVGKTLEHPFLVLAQAQAPLALTRDGDHRGVLKLPFKTSHRTDGLAVAVWITREDGLLPVQATGGFVSPLKKPRS